MNYYKLISYSYDIGAASYIIGCTLKEVSTTYSRETKTACVRTYCGYLVYSDAKIIWKSPCCGIVLRTPWLK